MKKLIPTTIVAALALAFAAPVAEARPPHRGGHHSSHVYISGYRSCGTPIYQERYIRHYKRCGTPVWGHRAISPPRHHYYKPRHHYNPRHNRHHYHHHRQACPPPRYHHRSGGRVIIQGILGL